MTDRDRFPLLDKWEIHLRSENKQPGTVIRYLARVRMYLDWCGDNGYPPEVDRGQAAEWVAEQLETYAAYTVISRLTALQRFAWWLTEVYGVFEANPLAGMKRPEADQPYIAPLTEDELAALIKACAGPQRVPLRRRRFADVRDEAMVRVLAETGMRAGELIAMDVADADLRAGAIIIQRGKGGKPRRVSVGPKTAVAIDHYLTKRAGHRLAKTATSLWLGDMGKTFGYGSLRRVLAARAAAAGLTDFHPHKLRHTLAHRWLEAGGSESGLMANNGWSRYESLARYTKALAEERAAAEARRLNLGDV